MAEVFGAAAGAIQLADVALRASREAYGFLAEIRDVGKDVQNLGDTLKDVESNVRSLRNYIYTFTKSRNAIQEFEVLPETITGCLVRFHEDIAALKSLLPPKPSPSLAQQLKWVYNKRKIVAITAQLNDRRADLSVALAITGRQHDLRLRQDNANLSASLSKIKNEIVQHCDSSHSTVITSMHQTARSLEASQSRILQELNQSRLSWDALRDVISDIKSTTTVSTSNADILPNIVRSEILSNLKPILERSLDRSFVRQEATLYRMEAMADQITADFAQHMLVADCSSQPIGDMSDSQCSLDPQFPIRPTSVSYLPKDDCNCHASSSVGGHFFNVNRIPDRCCSFRCFWFTQWRIGWIQIEVESKIQRKHGLPQCDSSLSIHVHFRPNQAWFNLPGLSIAYSTTPTQQGFYQIAPMIATFPIIQNTHPVIHAIERGDSLRVRELIASGNVHPRCQDRGGWTLLHWAAWHVRPELCALFLSYGLSWDHACLGVTPMHQAVYSACNSARHGGAPAGAEGVQMLRLVEESGGDISHLFQFCLGHRLSCGPLKSWRLDLDVIGGLVSRLDLDAWQLEFTQWFDLWWRPTEISVENLRIALRNGLDPNLHLAEIRRPLLIEAINGMLMSKKEKEKETVSAERHRADVESSGQGGLDEQSTNGRKPADCKTRLWDMTTILIQSGADIYWIDPRSDFHTATGWQHIWTPVLYAYVWDVYGEWGHALRDAGLNPDQVSRESKRRCQEAIRLHGARRTGVDEEVLSLPSVSNLFCRICRRKVCVGSPKHGYWPFEPTHVCW